MAKFKRGQSGNPSGRPKGSPNKTSREAAQAILDAFEKVGGVDYLVGVAQTDRRTFCMLLRAVLPRDVTLRDQRALSIEEWLRARQAEIDSAASGKGAGE